MGELLKAILDLPSDTPANVSFTLRLLVLQCFRIPRSVGEWADAELSLIYAEQEGPSEDRTGQLMLEDGSAEAEVTLADFSKPVTASVTAGEFDKKDFKVGPTGDREDEWEHVQITKHRRTTPVNSSYSYNNADFRKPISIRCAGETETVPALAESSVVQAVRTLDTIPGT